MTDIRIGIIGGTGLGEALGAENGHRHDLDTPFGKPSGPIISTKWHDVDLCILQRHGEGHIFSPTHVPYRANIFALKSLGVTHIIASGAVGSLRDEIKPRDLVIADQVIDRTYRRPNTFFEKCAAHVEFAEPFCPVTRRWLLEAGKRAKVKVHDGGTYVCMEGPQFSTKAESHMHRAWGGDLIGMTCMPEAKLAREAEMAYALIALPTDYDCWRPRSRKVEDGDNAAQKLLEEIIGNVKAATANAIELIKQALGDVTILRQTPSPAHDALKLAIWSTKDHIDRDEIKRLDVLWGRYF